MTTSIGTTATGEPCCCSSASESDSSSSSEGQRRRRRRLLSSDSSDSDSVDDPCASLSASDSSDGGTTASPGTTAATTCICPGSESDSSSSSSSDDDEADETEADALFSAGTVDKDIDNGIDAIIEGDGGDDGEYEMYVSFTKSTYLNAWGMVSLFLILNGLCCFVCYKKKKGVDDNGDRVDDLEASNLEIVS